MKTLPQFKGKYRPEELQGYLFKYGNIILKNINNSMKAYINTVSS